MVQEQCINSVDSVRKFVECVKVATSKIKCSKNANKTNQS